MAHANGCAAFQNSVLPKPMHGPAVAWGRLSRVLQQDSSGWDALLPAGCALLSLQPSSNGVLLHVSSLMQASGKG